MTLRRLSITLMATAALAMGAMSPASAKGCPAVGEAWSAWAQLGPGIENSVGEWTSQVASSQTTSYPVEQGPGVIANVVSLYC